MKDDVYTTLITNFLVLSMISVGGANVLLPEMFRLAV